MLLKITWSQFYYLFLFDKEQSLALNELTALTEEPIRPQIEELYQIQWKKYSENHLMQIFSHINIDETVDILHKRLQKYKDGVKFLLFNWKSRNSRFTKVWRTSKTESQELLRITQETAGDTHWKNSTPSSIKSWIMTIWN